MASKTGSTNGKPLVTDKCTVNKLHVSYTGILMKVDVTQYLAKTLPSKMV